MKKRKVVLLKGSVIRLLRKAFGRDHREAIISHSIGSHYPEVPSEIVPDLRPAVQDIQITERLLKAYKLCIADESASQTMLKPDVWSMISKLQSSFLGILERNDPPSLANYLCNMCRHDATNGTVQGDLEFNKISNDSGYREFVALMIKDKLVSLAEAVGVVPCENPEQGVWGKSLHMDIDSLVEKVEQAIGLDISPPPIDGGLLKIRSAKALYHERDLNAIYTAWSLKQILSAKKNASICEIGAGSGRVAYWCNRFGFKSYTIFDLPHINVIQGYYLLKSLPDARIVLYGESEGVNNPNQITIRPHFFINKIEPDQFDLVLNQDSFPEINRETVLNYLVWIKKVSRQLFYSINHESRPPTGSDLQQNIPALIEEVGGYQRIFRIPYWLRRGYVAELYTIIGK